MKRCFAITILLCGICAAQNLTSVQIYDQFTGRFLDSSKWLTTPTCSATVFLDTDASLNLPDCAREIQGNKLRLMVKTYGNRLSDVGRQFGPAELYFINPNAINTITTTLTVKRADAVACPTNTAQYSSISQTIFGGNYFNAGTGDTRDDVVALIIVEHDPPTPAGELLVTALVFSPNAFFGVASLGTVGFEESLTATVKWDQANHQFTFRAESSGLTSTANIPYSAPDTNPATTPVKLLAARGFAPNCTSRQAAASMDVLFDNVRIN